MLDLSTILAYNYFPKELPPPFHSRQFGLSLHKNSSKIVNLLNKDLKRARLCNYNLARPGKLFRRMGIPNPISYYKLVKLILENWEEIKQHIDKSNYSLTKTSESVSPYSGMDREHSFKERNLRRLSIRANSSYILKVDINRFYPSIYTHSLPWALHSKTKARRDNKSVLLGNKLDKAFRDCQDRQTNGIPIGPITSLVGAEVILSSIDQSLFKEIGPNAFRYIDDYEFGVSTYSEAESAHSLIEGLLNKFELSLNPLKTKIIELPHPIEKLWVNELRTYAFRNNNGKWYQKNDLIAYFDRAFELAKNNKQDNVLGYAIRRIENMHIEEDNIEIYQNYIYQCINSEPNVLENSLDSLIRVHKEHNKLDLETLSNVLNNLIYQNSIRANSSEIAWAIWAAIIFNVQINERSVKAIKKTNDSVITILTFDAHNKGIVKDDSSIKYWLSNVNEDDLYLDDWLAAYEVNIQGWTNIAAKGDYIKNDPLYKGLKDNGISFYDVELSSRKMEK